MEAVTLRPAAPARFGRLARSLPDSRLVQRIRAGDERAFEALYDRYHRPLLAFCRHMLGTREEAEDALQHVFVSAHKHLVARDEVVDLRPWLYAIARNRCLSVLRARRESVAFDDIPEPSVAGLSVAGEVEQRQDLKEVLGDLRRLPDDQRAALVLSELGALSHDEIADVLGVRRDKVKALVFQARESLAGWRNARNTDCREIREQLANLRGGALRRAPLRKHLEACDSCRDFRSDVRRQREAMALLLPVIPSIALKAKVIGAVTAGSAVPAGVGAGVAATTVSGGLAGGTAASGGALSALGGGIVAKSLVVAAIAGTAGGGYVAVDSATTGSDKVTAPPVTRLAPAAATPAAERSSGQPAAPARGQGSSSSTTENPGRGSAQGAARAKGKGKSDKATPGVPGRPPVAADAPGQTRAKGKGNGAVSRPDRVLPPTAGPKERPSPAKDRTKITPAPNGPAAPAADRPASTDRVTPEKNRSEQTEPSAADEAAPPRAEPARPERLPKGQSDDATDVVTAVLQP